MPEEGIASSGAEATVGTEEKCITAGNQARIFGKSLRYSNHEFLVETSHHFLPTLCQFILDGS